MPSQIKNMKTLKNDGNVKMKIKKASTFRKDRCPEARKLLRIRPEF